MTPAPDATWDALVVGGGVAGLVAARTLARAGLRTLLVEADDEVGGAVRGHTVAGLRLDAGAESFATRGGTVATLLDDLGLAGAVVEPQPRGSWVHLPSGDGPLPRTGLLGIPTSGWAPDVRRTLGPVGALRASLDAVLPARVGASETTLGGLVRARMGARVLDRLVRPIVAGVHAAEPDEVAVESVAPGLGAARAGARGSLGRAVATLRAAAPAGSAVRGIDGGLHVLVETLERHLREHGGTVRTGTRVVAVEAADATSPAGGYTVTLADENGETTVDAARLVLASPAAAALLAPLLPELEGVAPDDGAAITLVTLVVDEPALDAAPRGTGVLVAREATDVRAKALTHATAKWGWLAAAAPPGRHVVRLSYGRADETASATAGGAELADAEDPTVDDALRDASALLGVTLTRATLVGDAVVRWRQALPRPGAAHRQAVAAVRAAVARRTAETSRADLAVCGAWVAGNGLASVIPDAEAAARSLVEARDTPTDRSDRGAPTERSHRTPPPTSAR